jgi:hypothetical protein
VKLPGASLYLNPWLYIKLIGISPIVHFFFYNYFKWAVIN